MSLLGIDVGTTGCKAAVFSADGALLCRAYREYDIVRAQPGYAELDAERVWRDIQDVIREAAAGARSDPVTALSVSSLGEAVVPVSADRVILGPSLLNSDQRGTEYLGPLAEKLDNERLYRINGNTLGNHYSLTKLLWIRDHQPDLYAKTYAFLHWGAFVAFMLGADPAVDYCLANRTLLFDIDRGTWSPELMAITAIDEGKLPRTVPSGAVVGTVSGAMAKGLGLSSGTRIVAGAHDQCANAVGCGAVAEGSALFGMGTFFCIAPTFTRRPEPRTMIPHGLNTEHHAVPGRFVSFIYNDGGSLLKWYRDTFAARERDEARAADRDVYPELLSEIPEGPSPVIVLPHFSPTGPPEFIADSSGVMVGLRLDTKRGAIAKGILEGTVFYLRDCLDRLPGAGIEIHEFRAVGGGSHSDAWLQICADILGRPLTRAAVAEAGALGGAILAGAATGVFASPEEGAEAMVRLDRTFDPDSTMQQRYEEQFLKYCQLGPLLRDYLRGA